VILVVVPPPIDQPPSCNAALLHDDRYFVGIDEEPVEMIGLKIHHQE